MGAEHLGLESGLDSRHPSVHSGVFQNDSAIYNVTPRDL
jgi:hypothetical protein